MQEHTLFERLIGTTPDASHAARSVILIRLLVSFVFVTEGIQKFLYPAALGIGRFVTIGIPAPELTAPFIGVVEIVFGTCILVGLLSRVSAVWLIADISVAIATTKVPLLLQKGFWAMSHEARTDLSMFLSLVFLLIVGSGDYSLDRFLTARHQSKRQSAPPASIAG